MHITYCEVQGMNKTITSKDLFISIYSNLTDFHRFIKTRSYMCTYQKKYNEITLFSFVKVDVFEKSFLSEVALGIVILTRFIICVSWPEMTAVVYRWAGQLRSVCGLAI